MAAFGLVARTKKKKKKGGGEDLDEADRLDALSTVFFAAGNDPRRRGSPAGGRAAG